jgi:hypothetical protein
VLTINGVHILPNIVIINPIHANLVAQAIVSCLGMAMMITPKAKDGLYTAKGTLVMCLSLSP